jgi:hypothetical protein|tara:strand:+ start:48 stop:161 length:114 start_codon:yes stop_codon:yes gene_type:complete
MGFRIPADGPTVWEKALQQPDRLKKIEQISFLEKRIL